MPEEFIPDRFDPKSPYYLTPDGKKRHPLSFGPFLGGKRICLGKTFAENFGKCVLSVVISQMDFTFTNSEHYKIKPPQLFVKDLPPYNVTMSRYTK